MLRRESTATSAKAIFFMEVLPSDGRTLSAESGALYCRKATPRLGFRCKLRVGGKPARGDRRDPM
jgi:hypothetical protein